MELLLNDSWKALSGYDLTDKEMEFFSTAEREIVEGLSAGCFELADQ